MESPAADLITEQPKKITFRFCREWYLCFTRLSCATEYDTLTSISSNMLYPKENKENNTLMFACRTCQFSEPATSSCVYRNELANTVGETAGITQDVGSDPTVSFAIAHCRAHVLTYIRTVAQIKQTMSVL